MTLPYDRVEGTIGRYYKTHPIVELRDFFGPDIRLPAAVPYDPIRLVLSSEMPLAGLPGEIREPQSSGDDGLVAAPLPEEARHFVETATWTFAKTYAATWPHEYVARTQENAPILLALARHIFEHGTEERFYSRVFKYYHEGGKIYWSTDPTPEATDLINRCDETQTYEARLAAGTLPDKRLAKTEEGSGVRIPEIL
ncbi:MAG TPA: hypothetical protein VLI39_10730 [Sedimentisphaerales bacterium]|nr:hypothetical protein [Sedimentisphaerales bacterium]